MKDACSMDPGEIPPGDLLYEKLKASRLRPGQFRFGTLFVLTLVVAAVMAFPRLAGMGYLDYLTVLYGMAFLFAPAISCLVAGVLPKTRLRIRAIEAAVTMMIIVGPAVVTLGWFDSYLSAVMLVFFSLVFAWIPQTLILWVVWYLVARR